VGDACRGELNRQGHAIEPLADVRHERGVAGRGIEGRIHRLAALGEELDCFGRG
jgi:hypothetical protein